MHPHTGRRRTARFRALIALAVPLLVAAGSVPPAGAAPEGAAPPGSAPGADPGAAPEDERAATVTWTVRPADEQGPDGRSWVELTLDPGESATEHVAVRNLGRTPATFSITTADGYFTDTGRFNMLPSARPSREAGTWVEAPDTVTVEAGGSAVLPFTVTVPRNATPGDHPAGIAASLMSVSQGPGGANIGIESRVGFRVMTRVTGELSPSVAVDNIHTSYALSWNPFEPGSLDITYDAVNDGNTHLTVDAGVEAAGRTEESRSSNGRPGPAELLPGDRRSLTTTVTKVWPLGIVTGRVTLVSAASAEGDPAATARPVTRTFVAWAVPWPQLIILAGVLLVLAGFWRGRRQRRRLEQKLAQAQARPQEQAPAASG
ncbi:hypothetical protein CC117_29215 [Parafrankia colletiae]|uniref:DUF916 domain-containing protein n=1 Tax=Parafrankia colletiae TaxID=573497 RepID=A0A1S1Q2F6_9ACTN|nr:hypothetical protein [Parafrankia colletiae]MCK9902985.1 hypothetical protein [Frankia sp. Cpl3]OHV29083.1 hypothetical protein CC117_29215 [Parafrankia colletiae]